MKYFPLVWVGLRRKPARTILTALSVAIALLLFGALRSVTAGFDALANGMSPRRMRVQSRASMFDSLPLGYLEQRQRVPGVINAAPLTIFPAYFQQLSHPIEALAIDPMRMPDVLETEAHVTKADVAALVRTRTGAFVGDVLAGEYGWKVGDRIPLTAKTWLHADGSPAWTFDIVTIYHVPRNPELARSVWFNYAYLDQARAVGKGTVHAYVLLLADAGRMAEVAASVDSLFANSAHPTLTRSERDWLQASLRQIGDLDFAVNAIVGAALFALLFVTANTMMQSVRERTPELAIIKTVGFSDARVLALIAAEALVICLVGGASGLALADVVFARMASRVTIPIGPMPSSVVVTGLTVALGMGVLSALAPAWRTTRLSIVDALAERR